MPLVASGLENDGLSPWMNSPEPDIAGNAAAFAGAVESYASSVVPASTTSAAAGATLESALASAMALTDAASTAVALEAAFLAFATTLGGGMAGAGFVAVPPPAPVGFAALLAASPASASAAASTWASAIDTWIRTGTAAPTPPGTAFVPWS